MDDVASAASSALRPIITHLMQDQTDLKIEPGLAYILYSVDLKSGRVWILNRPKEVALQIVRISNGTLNPEA